MQAKAVAQFLIVGLVVGVLTPFVISICLFSTTLQGFLAPQPTPSGFWSGAATPLPTPIPNPVQVSTATTLRAGGGVVFLAGSVIGAMLGELLALRRWIGNWIEMRNAWLGAAGGSILFMVIALAGFLQ